MSFERLSTNQPSLFTEPECASASPAPRVKSARSANRAAWWQQDLSRTATYLMGQARSDEERAFVERLYDEAMAEGPDFINYTSLDNGSIIRKSTIFDEIVRYGEGK